MDLLFDIDGVLRNYIFAVYKTLKYHHPEKVPSKEPKINCWDFAEKFYPEFDKQELYHLIFNKYANMTYYSFARVFWWVVESINELKDVERVDRIFLRTHQPDAGLVPTINFILHHKIYNDGIFFTHANVKKNIIPNSILIDDKYENIIDHGIETSIVIKRLWNQKYKNEFKYIASTKKQLIKHVKEIINNNNKENNYAWRC